MIHTMRLHHQPFQLIKKRLKTIELRLNDEKRHKIKVGDNITFTDRITAEEITVTVIKLHKYKNFHQLYKSLPLEHCGYTKKEPSTANASDMEKYYTPEQQAQYGVVGIEFKMSTN